MAHTTQTHTHTYKHCDLETKSVQRANSVKKKEQNEEKTKSTPKLHLISPYAPTIGQPLLPRGWGYNWGVLEQEEGDVVGHDGQHVDDVHPVLDELQLVGRPGKPGLGNGINFPASMLQSYLRRYSRVNQEMQTDSMRASLGLSRGSPLRSRCWKASMVLRHIPTVEMTTNIMLERGTRKGFSFRCGHLLTRHQWLASISFIGFIVSSCRVSVCGALQVDAT